QRGKGSSKSDEEPEEEEEEEVQEKKPSKKVHSSNGIQFASMSNGSSPILLLTTPNSGGFLTIPMLTTVTASAENPPVLNLISNTIKTTPTENESNAAKKENAGKPIPSSKNPPQNRRPLKSRQTKLTTTIERVDDADEDDGDGDGDGDEEALASLPEIQQKTMSSDNEDVILSEISEPTNDEVDENRPVLRSAKRKSSVDEKAKSSTERANKAAKLNSEEVDDRVGEEGCNATSEALKPVDGERKTP